MDIDFMSSLCTNGLRYPQVSGHGLGLEAVEIQSEGNAYKSHGIPLVGCTLESWQAIIFHQRKPGCLDME